MRKEGSIKIFKLPLSAKNSAQMKKEGKEEMDLFPALEDQEEPSKATKKQDEDELEIEIEAAEDREALSDGRKKKYLLPLEVREHLKLLWQEEKDILDAMFGALVPSHGGKKFEKTSNYEQFFFDVLPVSATRYRPASKLGDEIFENAQNTHLTAILNANIRILEIRQKKGSKDKDTDSDMKEV